MDAAVIDSRAIADLDRFDARAEWVGDRAVRDQRVISGFDAALGRSGNEHAFDGGSACGDDPAPPLAVDRAVTHVEVGDTRDGWVRSRADVSIRADREAAEVDGDIGLLNADGGSDSRVPDEILGEIVGTGCGDLDGRRSQSGLARVQRGQRLTRFRLIHRFHGGGRRSAGNQRALGHGQSA